MAVLLDQRIEIAFAGQFERKKFGLLASAASDRQRKSAFKDDPAACFGRFAGADLCYSMSLIDDTLDHYFDLAATFFLPEKARLDYFGIVEDE